MKSERDAINPYKIISVLNSGNALFLYLLYEEATESNIPLQTRLKQLRIIKKI
jgi:hypothetical protein